jgi:putative DNA primase/helicase
VIVATSGPTIQEQDNLARQAIQALLAGVLPDTDPADCGRWVDRVSTLKEALVRGGQAAVCWEFNLMAGDYDLANLLAGPAGAGSAAVNTPPPKRQLPVQLLLDETADDEGNAQCVRAMFGDDFRYCDAYGYLHWTGRYWRADSAEPALDRATVYTLKQRRVVAAQHALEHIVRCAVPNARRVRDCKYLFQSLVMIHVDEFDQDPELLNVANGVLNLRTGQLTDHHPSQRFTYCLDTLYNPDADQSLWRQFLEEVVGGGPEVLEYLQLAVGYSLTGYTREECLFYVHGPTRSGKGTMTETLLRLLPKPLAVEVDFTTVTASRDHDTQNFDLAPLKPARVLFASESNKYETLNAGKIKSLTGGNEVRCAFKHRDHFSYRPQYKMWLVSNHPVNADVDDDALWYRVKVIEFPNSLAGHEDKGLKLRMRQPESLEGVLAWAVEGAIKWHALGASGLATPDAVTASTQRHRDDLDFVGSWLAECTEPAPAHWVSSGEMYRSYRTWCVDNGVEMKKQRSFTLSLKYKGYLVNVQKWVNSTSQRGIVGLRLI